MLTRTATPEDLNALWEIEKSSFDKFRRMSLESLKNSLKAKNQDVFVVESDGLSVAYAILFRYRNTHRLYSIAVFENYRNQGIGKALMNHMLGASKAQGISRFTLEADATNHDLLRFYESFGFKVAKEIKDYYGAGLPAYRMSLDFEVDLPARKRAMVNWVVTDLDLPWLKTIDNIHLIDAETYINDERFQRMKSVRIFNLCASYDYQSLGYYVSLLASARLQRVVPNVATINDFTDRMIIGSIGEEATNLIQSALRNLKSDSIEIVSCFGHNPYKKYQKLIRTLYQLFESPFLVFTFVKGREWKIDKVQPIPISEVEADEFVKASAIQYFKQKRFNVSRFKDYQYDLAILVDPAEVNPPSDKIALTKFKIAADRMGFFTEFITKDDYHRINEFDALFIRATTNVNDYTYQFSRYAYAEGLIVIDDPWSILKCSNKLFFTESMRKSGINIPKTCIVSRKTKLEDLIVALGMPIVLKQPDSAFSLGVFKVGTQALLQEKLDVLFSMSELVVAQTYIPSDYDWRIGVLDGVPLFACKYHMAKNHWQIINWQTKKKKDQTGLVDCFRIEDVPFEIIDHAIRASKAMGDGFYGVDLKVSGKDVYVIEVNDNPNVDYRTEDQVLGDALYHNIIRTLYLRIEDSRNNRRKVA